MTRYKYPTRKRADADLPTQRLRSPSPKDEALTGFVQGVPTGSQDEERFARSFYRGKEKFSYQVEVPTRLSLPNQEKRVDFIIHRTTQPFEPSGYIGHYFAIAQEANDRMRELLLNETFRAWGMRPLKVAKYTEYEGGQDAVDAYVRRELA